jgi:hypothetical protein
MNIAKELRRAFKEWFGSFEPQLFVTHNFGYRVSSEVVESHKVGALAGLGWNAHLDKIRCARAAKSEPRIDADPRIIVFREVYSDTKLAVRFIGMSARWQPNTKLAIVLEELHVGRQASVLREWV